MKLYYAEQFKHVDLKHSCKNCGFTEFLYDHVHGDVYCTNCGMIIYNVNKHGHFLL